MKMTSRLAVLAVAVAAGSALAAPPPHAPERSADVRVHTPQPGAQHHARIHPGSPPAMAADVGDPDSFGRRVRYVGLIASEFVDLETPGGCQATTDPGYECVTLNPQPQPTTFSFNDMGHITLPARATHSLLCFQMTALNTWQFKNDTTTPQMARIVLGESVTIENPLLADPSLIDPTTGQPFNGKLTSGIGLAARHWATLQPGAEVGDSGWVTRGCQGGAISKTALKQIYGLPDAIVNQFFQKPMTIRVNASGQAQLVEFAGVTFGVRFYGD